MRACSPPDSRPTGTSRCSGGNRKRLAHAATCTLRPWKTTASPSGASARRRGRSGSSHARCCSKRTVRRPSARSIEPASDQQVTGAAAGGDEVDAGGPGGTPRPRVAELLDEPVGLLDAAFRLGGARLGPAPQPLDLATDGVGERLLVRGLPPEELIAPDEELAVAPVGLEQASRVRPVDLEHPGGDVLDRVTRGRPGS